MTYEASRPTLHIEYLKPTLCSTVIHIPAALVCPIYKETLLGQSRCTQAQGFSQGAVPLSYIEQNFKTGLLEHVQEVLFKHIVLSFFYREVRAHKLPLAGDPRLTAIKFEDEKNALFSFECSLYPTINLQNWKFFPFKAPKRKNYKDLDRQVESFIKEERDATDNHNATTVCIGDWICVDMYFINEELQSLLPSHKERLWLKLGDEEADREFRDLFLGKKIGDRIYSNKECLQKFFSDHLTTHYSICLEIIDILSHQFFCFDLFKKHFRLKTNKEMLQKLVEVFSYRNDLSQRRSMIEEAFKILLAKHPVHIPQHLITRQLQHVLDEVQNNPDYNVYRVQSDFKERAQQLAEKQVKEIMIIDQIAYQEDISVNDEDIKSYLNFTKRPRMKDFLYFQLPDTRIHGQEQPISAELLKQYCLREKTLNYIIYYLTKK